MTTSPVDSESVRVSDILELLIGGFGGPIAGHGSQGHALNAEKARRDASIWVKQALGKGSDAARDQGGPRDGQTRRFPAVRRCDDRRRPRSRCPRNRTGRSEEHTSELQSLMRISYAVFCLKKKQYDRVRDLKR